MLRVISKFCDYYRQHPKDGSRYCFQFVHHREGEGDQDQDRVSPSGPVRTKTGYPNGQDTARAAHFLRGHRNRCVNSSLERNKILDII